MKSSFVRSFIRSFVQQFLHPVNSYYASQKLTIRTPMFLVLFVALTSTAMGAPTEPFFTTRVSGLSTLPGSQNTICSSVATIEPIRCQTGTLFRNTEGEPYIAVNPVDSNHVVGVWQQDKWGGGVGTNAGMGIAVSFDAGKTWQDKTNNLPITASQGNPSGPFRATDPWVEFSADGNVIYVQGLVFPQAGGQTVSLLKSVDGGMTWSSPINMPITSADKNSLTPDPRPGHESTVYAGWSNNPGTALFFSRSNDYGNTWSTPVQLPQIAGTRQILGIIIKVVDDGSPNGIIVASFTDIAPNAPGGPLIGNVAVIRSLDGGLTWSSPVIAMIETPASNFGSLQPPHGGLIAFDEERGVPFSEGGLPFLAINQTNGYLYLATNDSRFNTASPRGIGAVITMSKDAGLTWSNPIPVNPTSLGAQTVSPMVAVDNLGHVAVMFRDFRNDLPNDNTLDMDAWLAIFEGDLSTRLLEIRLSPQSFDGRQLAVLGPNGYSPGDYYGLTTDSSGNFLGLYTITDNLGLPDQGYPLTTAIRLNISTPSGAAGTYNAVGNIGTFAPNPSSSGLSGDIVAASPIQATTIPSNVSGKIALIDRAGGNTFAQKVRNAQDGGAIGVIIFDNVMSNVTNILPSAMTGTSPVSTIPAIIITRTDGLKILGSILGSSGTGTITGSSGLVSLDNRQDIQFFRVLHVHYEFDGFYQPVDNPPTSNTVKAGRVIPVKFSLNGDQGLNIFVDGYPKSVPVACPSSALESVVDEASTTSTSELKYDSLADQYIYTWKTEKNWSNTCRELTVKLIDGSSHKAIFHFIK